MTKREWDKLEADLAYHKYLSKDSDGEALMVGIWAFIVITVGIIGCL